MIDIVYGFLITEAFIFRHMQSKEGGLPYPEEEGVMILRNVSNYLPVINIPEELKLQKHWCENLNHMLIECLTVVCRKEYLDTRERT